VPVKNKEIPTSEIESSQSFIKVDLQQKTGQIVE
tara:strand:+ start:1862 stop:1963 length:102 start_codon:yes stop_codon:yes gene_type:complete